MFDWQQITGSSDLQDGGWKQTYFPGDQVKARGWARSMLGRAAMGAEVLHGVQNSGKVPKTLPMRYLNSLRNYFFF